MDETDVADANSVGLPAGHFVFWLKAEALPSTIKINDEEFTVEFVDE
jgi:hypothetical protein